MSPDDNIADEPRVVELSSTQRGGKHRQGRRARAQTSKTQIEKEPATPPPEVANAANAANATNTSTDGSTSPAPAHELSVIQACHLVGTYYKRDFKDLQFVGPMQFTDGAVVDFVDNGTTIATARLRLKNCLNVDNKTGNIMVPAYLTDLAFRREGVSVAVNVNKK